MSEERSLAQIVEEQIASGDVTLPVFDETATKLQQMISKGEFDPDAVEKLVGGDPVLSGSLLRHANSTFFGGIEKVVTVRAAIMRLGVKQVAELLILAIQKEQYSLKSQDLHDLADRLWKHAVGCGMGAQWLAKKLNLGDGRVEEAFLAGMLHDIGKLLLVRVLDDLIDSKQLRYPPSPELIVELLTALHAEHGYNLMQDWNIPDTYAAIVRDHHLDESDEHDDLLNLIRLVDTACNRLGIGIRGEVDINLAACPEAQHLRVSEILLAELEIRLEDAMSLAS